MVRTRVEICGIDTSELPLLTNDVMKATFIRLQSGDHAAREELVIGNLRLVLSLVQRFAYRGNKRMTYSKSDVSACLSRLITLI